MNTKHDVSSPPTAREDSHAFSLDALAAREAAQRSTPAQAADDSGVIDLDALRGVATTDHMVTSRLVPVPVETPAPRSNTPRWAVATLGLLGGAVVALTTMVALGVPHGTTATQDPADTPTMAASLTALDSAHEHRLQLEAAVIPDVAAPAEVPEAPQAAEPEPVATKPVKRASKSRSKSKAKTKTKAKSTASPKSTPPKTTAPASTPKPKAEPKGNDDVSLSCILDPASCGRGGKPKSTKPAQTAPAGNLPNKLSASQIRKALTGPKAKAKQCGDMHAAPSGTTVKVKLSVAGSGEVRSATPLAPHANGLGRCVANALDDATFDRFAAPVMGVVYSVRL